MFEINILLDLPKTQTLSCTHVPVYSPPYILSSIHFEQESKIALLLKSDEGEQMSFHNSTQELTTAGNCGLNSNGKMQLYLLFCQCV